MSLFTAAALAARRRFPRVPPAPGLPAPLATWEMDETSGTVMAASPATYSGTYTNVGLNRDYLIGGKSVYFDGTAWADIPNHADFRTAGITLAIPIEPTAAPAQMILLECDRTGADGEVSVELRKGSTATRVYPAVYVWSGGAPQWVGGSSSGLSAHEFEIGTAHLLVVSLGPAGARVYLDGALLGGLPGITVGWTGMTSALSVGRWHDGAAPYTGYIDRIRLWTTQLSDAAVGALTPLPVAVLELASSPSATVSWGNTVRAKVVTRSGPSPDGTITSGPGLAGATATFDDATGELVYTAPPSGSGTSADTVSGTVTDANGKSAGFTVSIAVQEVAAAQAVTVGTFGHTTVALDGGVTAASIATQPATWDGTYKELDTKWAAPAWGYVRRAGREPDNHGKVSVVGRRTKGTASIVVNLAGGGQRTLNVTVTQTPKYATVRYINDQAGNDASDGLTKATAWKTVAKAAAQTAQNVSYVFAGKRTDNKPQVYNIPLGSGDRTVLAASNVEFLTDPDDAAAGFDAIFMAGANHFAGAVWNPSTYWAVHSGETYRSASTLWTGGGGIHSIRPYYKVGRGADYFMAGYHYWRSGLNQLVSGGVRDTDRAADNAFRGPGCWFRNEDGTGDGRLYLRLTPPPGEMWWHDTTSWDFAALGWHAADRDPRNQPIYLAANTNSGRTDAYQLTTLVAAHSKSNIAFTNIHFVGGGVNARFRGCTGIELRGCRFMVAAADYGSGTTGQDINAGAHCIDAHDSVVVCNRCTFEGGTQPWTAYQPLKGNGAKSETSARVALCWGHTGPSAWRGTFDITFRNCVIRNFPMYLAWSHWYRLRIYNCAVEFGGNLDGGMVGNPAANSFWRTARTLGAAFNWNGGDYHGEAWGSGAIRNHLCLFTGHAWIAGNDSGCQSATDSRRERRYVVNHGGTYPSHVMVTSNCTVVVGPSHDDQHSLSAPAVGFHFGGGKWATDGSGAVASHGSRSRNNCTIMRPKARALPGGRDGGKVAVACHWDNTTMHSGATHNYNHYEYTASHYDYLGSGRVVGLGTLWAGTTWPPVGTLVTNLAGVRANSPHEANGTEGSAGLSGTPNFPEPWSDLSLYLPASGSTLRSGYDPNYGVQTWRAYDADLDGTEIQAVQPTYRGAFMPDVPLHEQVIGPL